MFLEGHLPTVGRVNAHLRGVSLSSVTTEEMIAGRMNLMNRARSNKDGILLPAAHAEFAELIVGLQKFPLFVYSPEAEEIFQTFPSAILRIGPQDCRIAAQALAHNLTVVTRNLRDFERIGAPCVDWSEA